MGEEKLLTVRDVSIILGISEKDVVELAEKGSLPAYKIGGVFLRFKREQVQDYIGKHDVVSPKPLDAKEYPLRDKLGDFFYFNDFYILSVLIIILLVVIIFRGY